MKKRLWRIVLLLGVLVFLLPTAAWANSTTETGYLTFSSDAPFTVTHQNSGCHLEYATSTSSSVSWTTFEANKAASSELDNGKHVLYVRSETGQSNTVVTGNFSSKWTIDTTQENQTVACEGNILTLLDYEKVMKSEEPKMDERAFANMFNGCSSLESAPKLLATTLADGCYRGMFNGCSSLKSAPELPATTLKDQCYMWMFAGCSSLKSAPELPATTLKDQCYMWMFAGCSSLESAPELPATALADSCYNSMFYGCSSLESAPELPATTLADGCYYGMFYECTSLEKAPELPATTLAYDCYMNMFEGCSSLESAPKLPATTLADGCYREMFYGCTSLKSAPELPATTLAYTCYANMFDGCTGIQLYESAEAANGATIEWNIPSGAKEVDYWNYGMFSGTGGTFKGNPEIGKTYYLAHNKHVFDQDGKCVCGAVTILFDVAGGQVTTSSAITNTDGKLTSLPTPTRSGYTFDGWYTEQIGGDKVTEAQVYSKHTTLYAHWTANTYTVLFNANGGEGSMNSQSFTYDAEEPLSANTFTRDGYTFAGWNREENGTGNHYEDGASVRNLTDAANGEVTLYAQWTKNPTGNSGSSSSGGSSGYSIRTATQVKNGTITIRPQYANKGDTVTITATPDAGYTLETLTVTTPDGKSIEVVPQGNNKYSFTMPSGRVQVQASFMDNNTLLNFFVDVSADSYCYKAVLWAAQNGITGGVDALHFAPNSACTRGQIVTFLWRAAGCPEAKAGNSFADVSADMYYAKAVAWAVEQGITSGTGEGKFSPEATCTRAQAVSFLYRYFGRPEVSTKGSEGFTDVAADAYYAEAVAWAQANGITGGIGNGLFGSEQNCTRGQIVAFLYRAMGK